MLALRAYRKTHRVLGLGVNPSIREQLGLKAHLLPEVPQTISGKEN